MSGAYYNENDPFAAAWLRALIFFGEIAPGDVDERSIEDVTADDLRGYDQHHFFAGIGVWSRALREAGWPDDRPCWTGSCPCQPFSAAGKGGGFADERHLWPAWFWLIEQHRPGVVLGEQIAAKAGLEWFDLVSSDLEGAGYTVGATDLCAAGVGAPHIRQRLWWCGVDNAVRRRHQPSKEEEVRAGRIGAVAASFLEQSARRQVGLPGCAWEPGSAVADAVRGGTEHGPGEGVGAQAAPDSRDGHLSGQRLRPGVESATGAVAHHHHARLEVERQQPARCECEAAERGGEAGALQHPKSDGREQWRPEPSGRCTTGFWRETDWIACRDGKWRPVEPGTFPLVNGAPRRVGRLRGYGNAIVLPLAKVFIEEVMALL